MKVAVTYENGQIFQHFGHTKQFKVYEIVNKEVVSSEIIDSGDEGHGALASLLHAQNINALICGGIGGGAINALGQNGIFVFAGVEGSCDEAIAKYIDGTLCYSTEANCSHHHEGEEHDCSSHGHSCNGSCHN